jgi:transposase
MQAAQFKAWLRICATLMRSATNVCRESCHPYQWEWVFQNQDICLHVIRPSQGAGVISEVLGEHRPQVWVSDLFSAQKNHPAAQWQVCLAHQLRDCQYAIDAGDRIFAPAMKRLLLRAFVIHRRRDRMDEARLERYRSNLRERLTRILSFSPHQPDGVRLRKRYGELMDNLFLFLEPTFRTPNWHIGGLRG